MALVYASASGNFSSASLWLTGAGVAYGAVPTASDDVCANGKTVTIDQDVTVRSLRTDASGSSLAGGGFTVTGNGRIINANIQAGTSNVLTCNSGINWFLNGNILTYSIVNGSAVQLNSAGQSLTMVGNVNGNGGASSNGSAIRSTAIAYITITGNVTGGSNGECNGVAIDSTAGGTITVTGNVTGGSASTGRGIILSNSGQTLTVNGTITGGIVVGAFINAGTLQGNCIAVGSSTVGGSVGVQGGNTSNCTIAEAVYTDCAPTSGKVRFKNTDPRVTIIKANTSSSILTEAGVSGSYPITSDVRNGITYANGTFTGTLIVADPSNIRKGVPTDNTTGSADLTAADMWNYLASNLTTSGSIGERMRNVATVDSVGGQIAAFTP